jgi:cobalt-zinc-cadmium efflux system membrane fusion protein
MSAAPESRIRRVTSHRWKAIVTIALIGTAMALVAWLALGWIRARTAAQAEPVRPPVELTPIVRMTPAKVAAAGIHVIEARTSEIQATRRVPGKITYNAPRRLEMRLPASGVVKQLVVRLGQEVKKGDALAIISSLEVGLARDEMNKAEVDVHLAKHDADWNRQIAENLTGLLSMLNTHPSVSEVESRYKDRILGDHRETIFGAYSKMLFADRVWTSTEELLANGALSERLVQERQSQREVSTAHFESVREQAKFDAHRKEVETRAALEHAERVLAVSRQKLEILLGPFAEIAPSEDATLCELIVRAPFDGVIEERFVSNGMQLIASQRLFTVTNTDTLGVSAQIYEREWAALAGSDVTEVRVESPALPGEIISASVQSTGVGISPDTHAVSLLAEFPNTNKHFKPGMFAWIEIPLSNKQSGLVIPTTAIMQHENDTFVFIEREPGVYEKTNVTPGVENVDRTLITSGLKVGDRIVDRGAFLVKSQMLLEGSEDD